MSARSRSLRLLVLVAVFAWPSALAIDLAFGREVSFLLRRHTPEAEAEWRGLRDARDDVAEIYGQPLPGDRRRVVLWRGDDDVRVVRPPEAPERTLLVSAGGDVLYTRWLHVLGVSLALSAGIAAALVNRRQRAA